MNKNRLMKMQDNIMRKATQNAAQPVRMKKMVPAFKHVKPAASVPQTIKRPSTRQELKNKIHKQINSMPVQSKPLMQKRMVPKQVKPKTFRILKGSQRLV